jgi:hypothetical protein
MGMKSTEVMREQEYRRRGMGQVNGNFLRWKQYATYMKFMIMKKRKKMLT